MSQQTFNRTISIYVESGAAQEAYNKLAATQEKLKTQVQEYIDKGKQIPEKLTKQLEGVTEQLDRQSKKISGELSPSYRDLTSTVTRLTAEVARMSEQDAGFEKKSKELHEAREQADHYKTSVLGIAGAMKHGEHEGQGFVTALKEIAAGFTLASIIEKAADKVKEFFSESVKEALALEVANKQLRNSLEATGRTDALERLNQSAEKYSKQFSYLYTPEITKVQTALIDFGRLSESQMNDLLPVIINFAAKSGESLNEATNIILGAIEGRASPAIKRLGIEITKDGGFAENFGKVMTQMAARVEGAADTFDKTGAGAVARYQTQMKELQETIGNGLMPIVMAGINSFTGFVHALKEGPEWIIRNRGVIISLIGAYTLYRSALILSTLESIKNYAVEKGGAAIRLISAGATTAATVATNIYRVGVAVLTGEIGLATAATEAWALATGMASGGITLLIGAVVAGGAALYAYMGSVKDATMAEKSLSSVREESEANMTKEKASLEQLMAIAKDETLSKERRQKAISEINGISKEYLGNITLENVNTQAATKAINEYITALEYKSKIEALSNELSKIQVDQIKEQSKSVEDKASAWTKFSGWVVQAYMGEAMASAYTAETVAEGEKEKRGELAKTKTALENSLKETISALDDFEKNRNKSFHDDPDYGKKKKDKELSEYEQFAKHLEDLKNEAANKTLSANDKEIADLDDKYHTEMDQLDKFLLDGVIKEKEYNRQKIVISKAYMQEFDELKAKQLKAATEKEYETAVKAVTATFEATRELNAKRLRDGEISEREYNQRLALLDQVELSAKIDLANKYKVSVEKAKDDIVKYNKEADDKATKEFLAELAKRKAAEQAMLNYEKEAAKTRAQIAGTEGKDETNQKLAELNAWFAEEAAKYEGQEDVLTKLTADYQAKRDKIIADGFKKTLQDVAKDIQKFGSALTGALDGIFKIMGQHEDHALKAAQNANKSKIKSYDEQLKHRQISQAQHDKLVEAANAEMARKEEEARKKKFEREKALGIVKATINMATGIMTAVAENPMMGGLPGSAIAALMGGIEIGVIASQKYEHGTPEFVGGSSHSAGGNAIIDRRTGREVGEMERGEAIIPKDARDANPALIRHLLGPGRKQNLLNTLRPVVPLDTHRNLANIEHSNNPRSEGGSGSSGTHMHDESVGLLREIHSTLTQHTALHKANADKPPLSLHHIQEAERKQAFILSQKM